METRRSFFKTSSQLAAGVLAVGALAASTSEAPAQTPSKKLKIMMRGGWGTDDPTRGSFVFAHALAFADAGHDVQIFLTGEATYLMRKATVDAVKPIGWPPLSEMMEKNCGQTHSRLFLRGLLPGPWGHGSRPEQLGSEVGSPAIFVSLVECADRVITE